jgi:hypothetical protein
LATASVEAAPDSILAFQQAADECLSGQMHDQRLPLYDWFYWARVIISFIRFSSIHPSRSLTAVLDDLGIVSIAVSRSGLAFEALPVKERALLLDQAWKVMSLDHQVLAQVFKAHSLPRSAIQLPRRSSVPSSFSIVLQSLCDGPKKNRRSGSSGRARSNVAKAWSRLQRKFSRDG